MASLFKRNGSKNWQIRYFKNGKEHFVSTGTRNRREAGKVLSRLEVKLEEGWYKKPSKTDIDEALDIYLDYLKAKTCHNPDKPRKTFKNVECRLKLYRKWLRDKHPCIQYMEQLDTDIILAYLTKKKNEDRISPKTYNHYRQNLHTFFAYFIKNHDFTGKNPRCPNPVTRIEKMPEQCPQITFLSIKKIHQQLESLLPESLKNLACENPWHEATHMGIKEYKSWIFQVLQPMVATLIYGGFRREELLWLTIADIDFNKSMIFVRSKTVAGEYWEPKTKKNRSIPISKILLSYLKAYQPPKGTLWFFPFSGGGRWNPDNFSKALREFNRAAGMIWQTTDSQAGKRVGMPWSSLDFRHTFGSQLAMKGITLHKISELMGNSPEICRRHYAHLTPESMRECVEFDEQEEAQKPITEKPLFRIIKQEVMDDSIETALPAG